MSKFTKHHGIPLAIGVVLAIILVLLDYQPEHHYGKPDYEINLDEWFLIGFFAGYIGGLVLMIPINLILDKKEDPPFTRGEMKRHVIPLVIELAKIDGSIDRIETLNFNHFIGKYFSDSQQKKMKEFYRQSFKKKFDLNLIKKEIDFDYDFNAKKALIYLLVNIAVSDRFLYLKEEEFLHDFCKAISFPKKFLQHYFNLKNFTTAKKHQKQERSRKSQAKQTFSMEYFALNVFNLDENASNSDIKRKYRELVKEFHPDMLTHASQFEIDRAEKEFQRINDSYEYLKEKRGIK